MKIKLNDGDKFFIIILLIYLVSFLINPEFTKTAFKDFLNILIKITPILLFIFIFMFILNYFLKDDMIKKHLGNNSGIKGWAYIIFSGIIIPSPPYIIIPLLGELKKKGMRKALIVSFLYARNLQITFLPVMAYYFGILFTIINVTYVFIFTILSGLFIEKIILKNN